MVRITLTNSRETTGHAVRADNAQTLDQHPKHPHPSYGRYLPRVRGVVESRLPGGVCGVDVDRPPEDLPQGGGLSVLRGHVEGSAAREIDRVQLSKRQKTRQGYDFT